MADEWQKYCTAELQKCIDLGRRGEAHWAVRRWQLHEESKTDPRANGRIIIADLNASRRILRRYSFFACYLVRCDFSKSNLLGSDFELAIIRQCTFEGADLTLSTFGEADIEGDNDFRNVTATNGVIDFAVKYENQPLKIDRFLLRAAESARDIDEAIRNEGNFFIRHARTALGHGLSLPRLASGAAMVIALFALGWLFSPIKPEADVAERVGASVLISMRYFLGLTDQFGETFGWWALIGLAETAVGLLFLAVLVAAVSRRFTVAA